MVRMVFVSYNIKTGRIFIYHLSHKLRCYTGISGSENSRNNTRETRPCEQGYWDTWMVLDP